MTSSGSSATVHWFNPLLPDGDRWLGEWARVHAAVEAHTHGEHGSAWTAAELKAFAVPDGTREQHYAVALVGGEVVAAGRVQMPLRENPEVAVLVLQVDAPHRGRGVGTALLEALEARAREGGRSTFLAETSWRAGTEDEDGGFAARRGYAAALTNLRSDLTLPVGAARLVAVRDGEGREDAAAYVIETAWDGIPESWVEDRALLARRMSTDIPLGDMELGEEDWDGERIRAMEARIIRSGRRFVESVARHVESGRLVGFTAYEVSAETPHLAYQADTLVIREHRGHRLGARVKAANTLALQQELPDVRTVRTWNAESNEPMLRVNREMGFVVGALEREWQKKV